MNPRTEIAVAVLGEDLVFHLASALARARALHPVFALTAREGAGVVVEEAQELYSAAVLETPERQREEATDVVVTGLRFLLGEHTEEGHFSPLWLQEALDPLPPITASEARVRMYEAAEIEILATGFKPEDPKA